MFNRPDELAAGERVTSDWAGRGHDGLARSWPDGTMDRASPAPRWGLAWLAFVHWFPGPNSFGESAIHPVLMVLRPGPRYELRLSPAGR